MDVIQAIEERRSIRKFQDKTIPKEILEVWQKDDFFSNISNRWLYFGEEEEVNLKSL